MNCEEYADKLAEYFLRVDGGVYSSHRPTPGVFIVRRHDNRYYLYYCAKRFRFEPITEEDRTKFGEIKVSENKTLGQAVYFENEVLALTDIIQFAEGHIKIAW